jgi:hypothetical protein
MKKAEILQTGLSFDANKTHDIILGHMTKSCVSFSMMRQVSSFPQKLLFLPLIKLIATR